MTPDFPFQPHSDLATFLGQGVYTVWHFGTKSTCLPVSPEFLPRVAEAVVSCFCCCCFYKTGCRHFPMYQRAAAFGGGGIALTHLSCCVCSQILRGARQVRKEGRGRSQARSQARAYSRAHTPKGQESMLVLFFPLRQGFSV